MLTLSQLYDLFSPRSRVGERVVLEEEPPHVFSRNDGEPGEAAIIYSGNHRVVIEAYAPQGGILVLSDTYFPEWHVYVDGEERKMMRANIAYRAVALEPGRHHVEFVFKPSSTYYGLALCAAGISLVFLILFAHKRKRWLDIDTEITMSNGSHEECGRETDV